MKLSLSRFIVRTITDRLAERSMARSAASAGALPSPGRPSTVTPRATSASRRARAARSGGESAGQPSARSTTSAESGGVSPPTKYAFHPAAPRRLSKADSSPRIRPVTLRIPDARNDAARPARSADVRVGSPSPWRYRSPSQVAPIRSPTPSTWVVKRNPGPSRVNAAHDTGSFSFDAGWTGTLWLCAKRTSPVLTSTAIADVRASERYGERRVFESRVARSPEAARGDETAVAAIATEQSASRSRTAPNRRR